MDNRTLTAHIVSPNVFKRYVQEGKCIMVACMICFVIIE